MLSSGLVSISFRKLNTNEIINIVKKAKVKAIEWGGDIHVPHGDINKAKTVFKKCKNNNIVCPSYGSYYRVGTYDDYILEFKKVLDVAIILKCKTIRVWVGDIPSKNITNQFYNQLVDEIKSISDISKEHNISISFEYHNNTLTDNIDMTIKILKQINRKNVFTYWQPPSKNTLINNVDELKLLLPYLTNIHIFYWLNKIRQPLSEGIKQWQEYIGILNDVNRYIMIEFVKDDNISQFYEDAKILKELINE